MSNNNQDSVIGLSDAELLLRQRNRGQAKLYKTEEGRTVIDHVATANAMVMFIANIKMDSWCKKVLIMRIGAPLVNQNKMTHLQIALRLGISETQVMELEEEGKAALFMALNSSELRPANAEKNNKSLIISTLNDISE